MNIKRSFESELLNRIEAIFKVNPPRENAKEHSGSLFFRCIKLSQINKDKTNKVQICPNCKDVEMNYEREGNKDIYTCDECYMEIIEERSLEDLLEDARKVQRLNDK